MPLFRSFILLTSFACLLLVSGCNRDRLFKGDELVVDEVEKLGADELIARAQRLERNGKTEEAAKLYSEVERLHPYSASASDSQLLAAKLYYDTGRYDDSVNAADRFIQLHPSDARAPYAYYLRALSYFDRIAETDRSQGPTLRAKDSLQDLIRRFPETKYALDAAIKLDLVNEQLAGREMEVARYYQRRDRLLAAANRYKVVVDDYDTTSHVEEALHRLVEVYLALGLKQEASRAAELLGHNYPSSRWYTKTYTLMSGNSWQLGRR